MDHFVDLVEDVSAEMDELTQYVSEIEKWEKAEPKEHFLYSFKLKYTPAWVKWVFAIVAVPALAAAIFFTAGTASIVLFIVAGTGFAAGGISAFFNDYALHKHWSGNFNAAPDIVDKVRGYKGNDGKNQSEKDYFYDVYKTDKNRYNWSKGKCDNWLCTKRFFRIARYYKHPTYDSGTAKHNCKISASADRCVKNAHTTKFQNGARLLLDANKPMFTPEDIFDTEMGIVRDINNKFDDQVNYLIDQSGHYNRVMEQRRKTGSQEVGSMFTEKRRSFLEEKHTNNEGFKEHLIPHKISYYKEFDENKIKVIKESLKKFAKCRKIGPGEDIQDENCKLSKNEAYFGGQEYIVGFGHLLETEEDINNFAEYFYQHHYHWPSLSATGIGMGYPLLAKAAYFESVKANLLTLGLYAARTSDSKAQAAELFKADLEKRIQNYDCSAESKDATCSHIQAAKKSMNPKYSKKFRKKFSEFNFQSGAMPSAFEGTGAITAGTSGVEGFSKAELAALNAGKKMALRSREMNKKRKHFDETIGKTERGKKIVAAQKKWLEKFGTPLKNMSVGGKKRNMSVAGGASPRTASSLKQSVVPKTSSLQKYTPTNYNIPTVDYGGSSYGGSGSSGPSAGPVKTGLSPIQKHILEQAKKQKAKYIRQEGDTIFTIISKTYYRNLSLVLEKKDKAKKNMPGIVIEKESKKISDDKKKELKNLLEN